VQVIQGVYQGVTTSELDNLAAETAAMMTTRHPDFGLLAARIAVSNLHKMTKKQVRAPLQGMPAQQPSRNAFTTSGAVLGGHERLVHVREPEDWQAFSARVSGDARHLHQGAARSHWLGAGSCNSRERANGAVCC
jgi:hypothetical protein